jgi:hypothetical protein
VSLTAREEPLLFWSRADDDDNNRLPLRKSLRLNLFDCSATGKLAVCAETKVLE